MVRSAPRIFEQLALALRQHADHFIGHAIYQDGFADPVMRREKVLIDVIADDRYVLAMKVLEIGVEPALYNARVLDLLVGGVGAGVVEVGDLMRAVTRYPQRRPLLVRIDARENLHGNALHVRTLGGNRLRICQRQRLAIAFFLAHASHADGKVPAEDEQRIGAIILQIPLNIAAESHQNRGDEDHRSDADHHAQHRQKRSRLVIANRLQRHLRIFAKV